jgi:hypothetical protein
MAYFCIVSATTRRNLIKRLQTELPRGRPFDTKDLHLLGISSVLASRYHSAGWVERLARGVYKFAGDSLDRDSCLAYLSGKLPEFHVGGKTALAWRGVRHNLPAREVLTLWGAPKSKLPQWFSERFESRYTVKCLFDPSGLPELRPLPESPDGVPVSSLERALIEMLSETGVAQEVEEARNIMESARSLRSKVVAQLLQACRQEKAARLCVGWAEELVLPWANAARQAVGNRFGTSRWVTRLKDGSTLILKP